MAAEYGDGGVYKEAARGGVWRAYLRYRDAPGEPWKKKTRTLKDVPHDTDPDSNRGRNTAIREYRAWRAEFVARHDAEQRRNAMHAGGAPATVGEAVYGYIERKAAFGLEASTIKNYRSLARYINYGATAHEAATAAPVALGGKRLEELTRAHVQAWVADMAQRLAPSSVAVTLQLLSSVLEDAVECEFIAKNPARGVKGPRKPKDQKNHLPAAEEARLIAELNRLEATNPGGEITTAVRTALLTGMRQGEICALRWEDVELEPDKGAPRIDVRRAFGHGEAGYYLKPPKSDAGNRSIPLTPAAAATLKRRRDAMRADCLRAGVAFTRDMYAFGMVDGTPPPPAMLRRKWTCMADHIALKGVQGKRPTFHDLRHTFATDIISTGADIKSVQTLMGHSSATTTLDTYAGVDEAAQARTIAGLGKRYEELEAAGVPADIIEFRTGTNG